MICTKCGRHAPVLYRDEAGAWACPPCGGEAPPEVKRIAKDISDGWSPCPKCGVRHAPGQFVVTGQDAAGGVEGYRCSR